MLSFTAFRGLGAILGRPSAVPVAAAKTAVGNALLTQNRDMASKRHKKIIKMAKGYRGRAKSCFSIAVEKVEKGLQYAYAHRKQKKRQFRTLWIQRINAAAAMYDVQYSRLINGLNKSNMRLNRKVLADLAVTEPLSFRSVVEVVKAS